jgi:hypothetical protein
VEVVPVLVALILVSIGFAVTLGILLFGGSNRAALPSSSSSSAPAFRNELESESQRRTKAEAELQRKQKELDEQRTQLQDVKDQLKQAKRKIFEQKESDKGPQDLAKARAEVERAASIQLESTRAELATALADIQKLKSEAEGKKKAAPVEKREEKKEEVKVEKPQEVITRVIRELSDVEKDRIARLEASSSNDRKKANELDRELKSLKAKMDRQARDSKRVYSEAELARDKFRAVEMRLNRTIMENDLLKRAIKDLEKKSGVHAGQVELTADEVAKGDADMKTKFAAEDAAAAEAKAKLEAAPATQLEEAAPAAAEAAPAPAADATPTAQA